MKVVITGSSGFIGSHLYRRMKQLGHEVVGIDNLSNPSVKDIPSVQLDVRNKELLLPYLADADIVFHLAAQISVDKSISDPQETIDVNILGTQNILELARTYSFKVVFASTSEVYGSAESEEMTEGHPLNPFSPYGASKLAADRMCYAYWKTFGTDVVVVRNFNTFGEYQRDDSYGGVISKFVTAALKDEPLHIFGDGTQRRDYMHVSDAIQAYELATCLTAGSVLNFGTGKTVEILSLAKAIIRLCDSKSKIIHLAGRPGEVQCLRAGIGLAKQKGFCPKTDFERNLQEYIVWKSLSLSSVPQ